MSLVRLYREERRDQDFLNLCGKVTKITSLTGDQRAWLEFERCLFFLERSDDTAALVAVEAWPTATTDPMWAIRRAGMLAELGEHESAKQIAKATLDSIRQGQLAGFDSIPVYSREGWASHAANYLEYEPHSHNPRGLEEPERDRWRELEQLECNPKSRIREFEEVSDDSVPRLPKDVTVTYGFQPGTVGESHSSTDIFLKVLPAYQAIRFCELIGEPLRAGFSTQVNAFLKAAARWFADIDEVRTISIIGRTGDEKLISQFFSRHRVAKLSIETIENLVASTKQHINHAIGAKHVLKFKDRDPGVERIRRRLTAAVAILARVLVRLPPEKNA